MLAEESQRICQQPPSVFILAAAKKDLMLFILTSANYPGRGGGERVNSAWGDPEGVVLAEC